MSDDRMDTHASIIDDCMDTWHSIIEDCEVHGGFREEWCSSQFGYEFCFNGLIFFVTILLRPMILHKKKNSLYQ